MEFLRERIREQIKAGNLRRIAREAGVAPNTIYKFVRDDEPVTPHKDTLAKLTRWLEKPAPAAAFWDGVDYAAELMSETIAKLLREKRLAREGAQDLADDATTDARAPAVRRAAAAIADASARAAAGAKSARPQSR